MRRKAVDVRVLAALKCGAMTRKQLALALHVDVRDAHKAMAKLLEAGNVRHAGWDGRSQRFALK
jgi:hypothetical protein